MDPQQNMADSRTSNYPEDTDKRASLRVIETIAEFEDIDQRDLPPIADALDPDSLNRIADDGASICFDYAGHEVCVLDSGDIVLRST